MDFATLAARLGAPITAAPTGAEHPHHFTVQLPGLPPVVALADDSAGKLRAVSFRVDVPHLAAAPAGPTSPASSSPLRDPVRGPATSPRGADRAAPLCRLARLL